MNKEEIIALAEEKGACTSREHWELYPHRISFGPDELFAFTTFIQDKQREEDAKICEMESEFLKSDHDGSSLGCSLCAETIRSNKE